LFFYKIEVSIEIKIDEKKEPTYLFYKKNEIASMNKKLTHGIASPLKINFSRKNHNL
jgi:hypothetical protein